MTIESEFDRIAKAWLADGPAELPERVLDAVVDEIHLTRQRRAVRAPWRFHSMTTPMRLGAAAFVGVLAVGGLLLITRPGQPAVAGPSPNASVAATVSPPTSAAVAAVPALTGAFASARHGYTVRYPAGWTTTPATESWKTSTWTTPGDPALDAISSADARLSVASQPLTAGQSPDLWLGAYCHRAAAAPCSGTITIGGVTGSLAQDGGPAAGGPVQLGRIIFDAGVVVDRRGYEFTLDGHVDRALFEALLASVSFDAASAIDLPPLTGTFRSPMYGYSIKIASGWTTTAGTTIWTGTDDSLPGVGDKIDPIDTDTSIEAISESLPAGTTFDARMSAEARQTVGTVPAGCEGGDPSSWPELKIGPATGRLQQLCNAAIAYTLVGGRVYEFDWGNSTFEAGQHFGQGAWEALLKSVVFDPSSAKR